jgi:hypothetical protein
MCPTSTRLANTTAKHEHVNGTPVYHIGMKPVIDTGSNYYHRFPLVLAAFSANWRAVEMIWEAGTPVIFSCQAGV